MPVCISKNKKVVLPRPLTISIFIYSLFNSLADQSLESIANFLQDKKVLWQWQLLVGSRQNVLQKSEPYYYLNTSQKHGISSKREPPKRIQFYFVGGFLLIFRCVLRQFNKTREKTKIMQEINKLIIFCWVL